ncbi:hypothetical protein D3C84_918400 [compost metagenome]
MGMALLRVELHGEARAVGQRCSEVDAIVTATDHLPRVGGGDVVAVHEVKTRHVRNVVPQRVADLLLHLVPAHVRDFQVLAVFMQVFAEELHRAREQADAVDAVVLFTGVEQGLHADTDAKKWTVLTDFTHQ